MQASHDADYEISTNFSVTTVSDTIIGVFDSCADAVPQCELDTGTKAALTLPLNRGSVRFVQAG